MMVYLVYKNVVKSEHIKQFTFLVLLPIYLQHDKKVQNIGHLTAFLRFNSYFPLAVSLSRFCSSILIIN